MYCLTQRNLVNFEQLSNIPIDGAPPARTDVIQIAQTTFAPVIHP